MTYINGKYQGTTETIDQFETRKEAQAMIKEYREIYWNYNKLWLSSRCTNEWKSGRWED